MPTDAAGNMPVDKLKIEVKSAINAARAQNWEEFFAVYARLFHGADFAKNKPEDQRQALKLMITTKGLPAAASDTAQSAYRAAHAALSALVARYRDPRDFELLGLALIKLQDEDGARKVLNDGLEISQAANDGDQCGVFLRHLATL